MKDRSKHHDFEVELKKKYPPLAAAHPQASVGFLCAAIGCPTAERPESLVVGDWIKTFCDDCENKR